VRQPLRQVAVPHEIDTDHAAITDLPAEIGVVRRLIIQ
jgi:hypothetical protein